jgi:hypothetical protein
LSAIALMLCLWAAKPQKATGSALEQAAKALSDFRAEEAVALLEKAKKEGPYGHADYIRLYEQLGIAYGYLDKNEEALKAFEMLLALDAGKAISYTLSPKVTFLFEQARSRVNERQAPALDLGWPLGLTVEDPIPIDVEVIADPLGFLRKATLHTRLKGMPEFKSTEVSLPPSGQHVQIELPTPAAGSAQPELVDIYLVAFDGKGNEVYQWGTATRPREIPLRYAPPDPWYGKWWIWAIAGTVAAAGAGAAVFAATKSPGPTVNGTLRVFPQ